MTSKYLLIWTRIFTLSMLSMHLYQDHMVNVAKTHKQVESLCCKVRNGAWSDGPVFQSTCCSCREAGSVSSTHMAANNYSWLLSRDPTLSSDLYRHQGHTQCTCIHAGRMLVPIIEINAERFY